MNISAKADGKVDGQASGSRVADDLHHLSADLVQDTRAVENSVTDSLRQLGSSVKARISVAQEALTGQAKRAGSSVKHAAGSTDAYVKGNPWKSIGVALLIGTALGAVTVLAARRKAD